MAEGNPYPVKAFALRTSAHVIREYPPHLRCAHDRDLIVAYEHMLTPTAQLADYVLPGESWLERPGMMAGISDQSMEPPGECKSIVYFFTELAKRMGLAEHFPWDSNEALLDYRLEPVETNWAGVVEGGSLRGDQLREEIRDRLRRHRQG